MNIDALNKVALTIRTLSMDAVQKANSGHPGLPMGMAELGSLLYGEILKHDPDAPDWIDRDRFVLSAGHGSMFLYSLLYLSGYGMTMEDLKGFRQLGTRTPGHPEYGVAPGIETTTGPLGQGVSNAVGMAIAETMLAAKFNTPEHAVIDHYTYALVGDGCMMEGVSSEASSLAAHLKLGKLIVFYDSNRITIEGPTSLAFTEDTAKRYEGYGWHVQKGDAYDLNGIMKLVENAKKAADRPSIIVLTSVIGKGSPNKAGSHDVHGAPLGEDEIIATRKNLGVPEDADFYVAPEALSFFEGKKKGWKAAHEKWNADFAAWAKANPGLEETWDLYFGSTAKAATKAMMPVYKVGDSLATRKASGSALQALADAVPNLVGGSADLAPSNNTALPKYKDYTADERSGRVMHFGVREHGMGSVLNGMMLHGGLRPFGATFLVFADYMRPPMRLAALMKLPVIYIMTHDSIFVGEDGPTHQPVEQIASMRIIPNLRVLRPGDAEETNEAWLMALERTDGPTVLALTRQNLTVYPKHDGAWKAKCRRGAYVVRDCDGKPDVVVVAAGSEVELALEGATKSGKKVRVVSMISRELFEAQDAAFRETVIPKGVRVVVAEAGVSSGWEGIASSKEDILCIDRFGESGPAKALAAHFGFDAGTMAALISK